MSIININQLSFDYGEQTLFENLSLALDAKTKAGLIGKNGSGKSTLFKLISKVLTPYKGHISVAKGYKIGYFTQDYIFESTETLWDWLYQSNKELMHKKKELEIVEEVLRSPQPEQNNEQNNKFLKRLHDLQTEYELLGGYSYQQELKTLLINFGFGEKVFFQPINSFSGGEKTRIRLISFLLNRYSFILFDEPTNHLDLITVAWFIKYLQNLPGGYLIISHDRHLLDQTVQKIYHLNNQRIDEYRGNYSAFYIQWQEKESLREKKYVQQQKFIEKTEDFIQRNMVRASTSNRAKSRLKMLNRIERLTLDRQDSSLSLRFKAAHRSGNDIFRLKNLTIGYHSSPSSLSSSTNQTEKKILATDINLHLGYQQKVCLVGANGSGKTTLLKIFHEELEPLAGELWTGYNLSVGYYDQLHIDLDLTQTVLETIWNLVPSETFGYVMSYLARFGFYENQIEQKVASLSGGEKSRLYLAQLLHENPNLLILDEPTNHLDIGMMEALEQAIRDYEGTVILVSHDQYFIEKITDEYWVLKDQTIKYYRDTFSNILEKINPLINDRKPLKKKENLLPPKEKKVNVFQENKLLAQIESLEKKISLCKNEIFILQNKYADPLFTSKPENISNTKIRIERYYQEIEELNNQKNDLENDYLTNY